MSISAERRQEAQDMAHDSLDLLEFFFRWIFRILTIAVGTCLGLILFALVAREYIKHEVEKLPDWPPFTVGQTVGGESS